MEPDSVEQQVHLFLDKTVLEGQGGDLTPGTPLCELGILDSFTFFLLMSFIEKEFGIAQPLESLVSDDFKDIASIASFIRANRQ